MPQIRYFHRGRFFRPSKSLHFLPPLKLTTGASHHPLTADGRACKKTSTRGHGRDGKHSRYRKMVMTLANYLTLGNIADMKFLCRDHVRPPQIVDDVTSAKHLFALLENQRLLAENSLYFLQTLLYYIARPDLYQMVLEFRADRQEGFIDRGVGVDDKYQVNQENDAQRLELAKELLRFRKDLKPRRRLNQVDVSAMRRKLEALSVKMQDNISVVQRPDAPNPAQVGDIGSTIMPAAGGRAGQETEDTTQVTAGSLTKPVLEQVKSDEGSHNRVVQTRPTSANNKDRSSLNKAYQRPVKDTEQPEEHPETSRPSTQGGGGYTTEDEAEESNEEFEYETPCPPPRENTLGTKANGVRVYEDANNAVRPSCENSDEPSPWDSHQMARKIHKLRRLSKDQRGAGVKGRFQRNKKKKKPAKTKSTTSTDNRLVPSRAERLNGKDELKLPDIYDKYARQTAVQYYS